MDKKPFACSREEYERHLYGRLCWNCHGLTQQSHQQQHYCKQCRRKWNYRHQLIRWELVKAFALGAPAYQASRVLKRSYSTVHAIFQRCRLLLLASRRTQREAVFARDRLSDYEPDGPRARNVTDEGNPLIIGVVECRRQLFSIETASETPDSLLDWMNRHNLRGCCLVADPFRSISDLAVVRPSAPNRRARRYHIDRLESFFIFFRRQWQQAPGVTAKNLPAYLAESEWRFNRLRSCMLDLLYADLIANERVVIPESR